MSIYEYIIGGILIFASLLIIFVILLQEGRQANVGVISGAADSFLDKGAARKPDQKLAKWTKVIAVAFFVLVLAGMLVTNPIPEEYAMPLETINAAIDQAIAECEAKGIHGKETTPFLLARVTELTGGNSLESNIRLVFNNARLAAKTAAAYCEA